MRLSCGSQLAASRSANTPNIGPASSLSTAPAEHNRPIRLEPWQEAIVYEETEEFVRGLIESDGCRVVANDRGVMSIRHHFSNRSEDIIALFTAAL
ncbi:MAG: hypothetical protein QOI28_3772, partial [Mycobacterium sp.]|nr:hypothetical protein [Mycobacterium sp.]